MGDVFTYERCFTRSDVRQFGDLSGDQQSIHTEANEAGEVIVQGLLTATLPTKIGGDLGVLARTMEFSFRRPVYTNDPIRCRVTITALEARAADDRLDLTAAVRCENDAGDLVLVGEFSGLVRADS